MDINAFVELLIKDTMPMIYLTKTDAEYFKHHMNIIVRFCR